MISSSSETMRSSTVLSELPVSGLSMNSACPCPAGDHSTRQWLTRSAMVLPPSLERRMNEFSPVITTSCGSTNRGSDMGLLLICEKGENGSAGDADLPGHELVLAQAQFLAPGLVARGGAQDELEDLFTHLVHAGRAIHDLAAIDVHILLQLAVHRRIGGELDRRRGLAAERRAAAGGEAHHVGAARDLPRGRYRVVARRVHEHEALLLYRLGVTVHLHQRPRPAFHPP